MRFEVRELLETLQMIRVEHLNVRAVTLGLNVQDCTGTSAREVSKKLTRKIRRFCEGLPDRVSEVAKEYGVPVANSRLALSPLAESLADLEPEAQLEVARALDEVAGELGLDFVGGWSALVHKGHSEAEARFLRTIPEVLASTERLCSSVNAATTRTGINMDAVALCGEVVKRTSELTADRQSIGCARFVVFANAPEDNPFMAGAFHGPGEPEAVINVGVSGPGVIRAMLESRPDDDLTSLAEAVKKAAFKITRVGELVGREVAQKQGVPFGIVDLSLAPTPVPGDSVAEILVAMGLEQAGAPGSTAALFLLTDAVKKGGTFASSSVGGLSGAFMPVMEDARMAEAAGSGALSVEKLEAMTAICSVGLDMIPLPGDTPAATLAGLIADEMAIGVANNKTTGARLLPIAGKVAGDRVELGGLLGAGTVMRVSNLSSAGFIARGGRIPACIRSLNN